MAKIKNKSTYSTDHSYLKRLAEELEFLGRPYKLDLANDRIIQIARRPKKVKKKKGKRGEARNKRAESASRNMR